MRRNKKENSGNDFFWIRKINATDDHSLKDAPSDSMFVTHVHTTILYRVGSEMGSLRWKYKAIN